jgi:ubiquinone/menaquinone biosynthesis C-methylase UbiE
VLLRGDVASLEVEVGDFCSDGLLVRVPEGEAGRIAGSQRVAFLDGLRAGRELYAAVCHQTPDPQRPGWRRIGLSTSAALRGGPLPVERRDAILPSRALDGVRRRWRLASAGMRVASQRSLAKWTGWTPALPRPQIVEFHNERGERLRGVLDACGDVRGAPLVLIPPAWAKTKETLLPLARSIVETFRRAGESVAVVRLDGIRRRGESHNDPECRMPGRECHHLTFSQGIRDIRAALDHFESSEAFRPATVVLVTFSGAAIEARRALAAETRGRVGGWVSVVGAADLKSGLRTVSGGVDYIGGCERDVRFGIQRILGIEVDIDRVAADALEHRMAYLEDARCDLEKLELPITWIQGRYDAWIDPERVQQMLSCGDASRRRVIEVPTGHQLRNSREALETFQLVAQEIGRIALGREVVAVPPDLADLERRRQAERARLPRSKVDLRAFWRDYLLGRDRTLGMELLTATQPYRELMEAQVRALALAPGDRVADLGCGTGAFPLYLLERRDSPAALRVDEIDYVREALARARGRLAEAEAKATGAGGGMAVRFLSCNLDLSGARRSVPVADARYDRVIASLLLNYVAQPAALLAEMHRLLRPGGRVVLSTLRRDADISRIYRDVSAELHAGGAMERLGEDATRHLDDSLHEFLNEAARLLDLEEEGIFHFWDADELVAHLRAAGFTEIETCAVFGDPPQAIVVSAVRA